MENDYVKRNFCERCRKKRDDYDEKEEIIIGVCSKCGVIFKRAKNERDYVLFKQIQKNKE